MPLHVGSLNTTTFATLPSPSVFAGGLPEGWSFEVYDSAAALGPQLWRTLFPPGWKDERYYQTLEETFQGEFSQFYVVLKQKGGQAVAIQPVFFVEQDLTVSLPAGLRAALRPAQNWLRQRLMMVGCIVGDGCIGVPELGEVPAVIEALAEALECFARNERVSIILFKDFPAFYRAGLSPLIASGRYSRLPSLPGVSLRLDFTSYDDYLQARVGKATRKSLRRKFREVGRLPDPITLEVKTSITDEEAGTLHSLYERVARRGAVTFEVFSKEYFLRLGERMPDQTRYFIWRHAGRVVAFSFCTMHADTLYDNDLGMDEEDAAPLHLYHVTFRDLVRWALAQGLKRYCSSPFNYDPKLHLRMQLEPLDLYARHLSPIVNLLLRWFAPLASPTRQEPLLRRFPNAENL